MARLKHMQRKGITLLGISFLSACAIASSTEQIDSATRISAEELHAISTREPELIIIDSRLSANRKHSYRKGSCPLPDTETTCESLKSDCDKVRSCGLLLQWGQMGAQRQGGQSCDWRTA